MALAWSVPACTSQAPARLTHPLDGEAVDAGAGGEGADHGVQGPEDEEHSGRPHALDPVEDQQHGGEPLQQEQDSTA